MGSLSFEGIWVPLVTPLRGAGGGEVDLAALAALVRRLAAQGVAGFVALGSTGEAAMLDPAEQEELLAAAIDAAAGKPVLCGLAGTRPERVAERARQLGESHRPAAFLLTAPAYVRPSQAGIVHFFHHVADASPVPLVAYDHPGRTGVRIEPATLLELAAHPRIVALKDCSGQRDTAETVLADGRLALLAGNDDELFDQLARGAVGGITASAHLATTAFVALHRALAESRLEEARQLWRRLQPLTRALFAEPSPAPLKAALAEAGEIEELLRAPMWPASPAVRAATRAALERATSEELSRR